MKNTRLWWLGLAVIAAMLVVMPTALAQGPVETAPQETGPASVSPQTVYVPGGENWGNTDGGTLEVGVAVRDYVNMPGGDLPNAIANGWGVYNQLGSFGWVKRFIWTNGNSWESDFKRNSLGGNNQAWVDNVDLMFYEGHGWPGGFTFYNGDLVSCRRPTVPGATGTSSGLPCSRAASWRTRI